MLPGAAPFSVSKFIWLDLITSMCNGVDNFPYAPYVIVDGVIWYTKHVHYTLVWI
jgi:hypothetical protein